MLADPIPKSIKRKSLILGVDTNEDNLLLLNYVLESFTCKLITARNSEQALALARQHLPELIILEIVLPKEEGIKLVNQLKQDTSTSKIPIIAVTTLVKEEDKKKIFEIGCTDYLAKPYMIQELEQILNRYCQKIQV
jgi:CheY-like chemotaxis protein